jgi:hypothetical protein
VHSIQEHVNRPNDCDVPGGGITLSFHQYIFVMASKRRQEDPASAVGTSSSRDEAFASSTMAREPESAVPPQSSSTTNLNKSISFSEYIREAEGPMVREREYARRKRREDGQDSADETTSILGSEVGGPGKGYSSGPISGTRTPTSKVNSGTRSPATRAMDTLNGSRDSLGSPVRRRSIVPREEKQEPWWRKAVEKYGSVELENKGSVARDHLALGTRPSSSQLQISPLTRINRTNIPRLAPHLPLLCLHWYSNNATLPPQHVHLWRRRSRIKTPPRWKTSRVYVHRYLDSYIVYWLS